MMVNREQRIDIGAVRDEHRVWLEGRLGSYVTLMNSRGEFIAGRMVECLSENGVVTVVLVCAEDAGDC